MKNSLFIQQTPSTNALLWSIIREENPSEGFVLHTDFQTDGKGQIGNSWESEVGKNLLFSLALFPHQIKADQQFLISELVSVAIKKTLDEYTNDITVKWPNDIYWKDKKLAGILIENSLQGMKIKSVVVGIGLNVNQTQFVSNAPNPISLQQITGKEQNRKQLLQAICNNIMDLYKQFDVKKIQSEYAEMLYRKDGFHTYSIKNEIFQAKILTVHPDGQLEVETKAGERKGFYFKEISFVID
jgi:BirA family biotin operon repressor/biotin-[acetyl-CoA-carboxylase] ligase